MKQEHWTKKCSNGENCVGATDYSDAYFIPDNVDICENCLLSEYGLLHTETYDALDHLGLCALYTEDQVINALRAASGK